MKLVINISKIAVLTGHNRYESKRDYLIDFWKKTNKDDFLKYKELAEFEIKDDKIVFDNIAIKHKLDIHTDLYKCYNSKNANVHISVDNCVSTGGDGGGSCKASQRMANLKCEDCPIGKHVSANKEFCSLCVAGKFQDEVGKAKCKACTTADAVCNKFPGATSQQAMTGTASTQAIPSLPPAEQQNEVQITEVISDAFTVNNVVDPDDKCASSRVRTADGIDFNTKVNIYIVLGVMALASILMHRYLPEQARGMDLMFAKVSFYVSGLSKRRITLRRKSLFGSFSTW